ncbi:MAG: hypothetical protein AAF865_17115 [Pseudomonadota bacterium]
MWEPLSTFRLATFAIASFSAAVMTLLVVAGAVFVFVLARQGLRGIGHAFEAAATFFLAGGTVFLLPIVLFLWTLGLLVWGLSVWAKLPLVVCLVFQWLVGNLPLAVFFFDRLTITNPIAWIFPISLPVVLWVGKLFYVDRQKVRVNGQR